MGEPKLTRISYDPLTKRKGHQEKGLYRSKKLFTLLVPGTSVQEADRAKKNEDASQKNK